MPARRAPKIKYPLVLRGRAFSREEVRRIGRITDIFYKCGRTRISEEVCQALAWRQSNGWLKDRACRDVLRQLAGMRLIRLPKARVDIAQANRNRNRVASQKDCLKKAPIRTLANDVSLRLAKGNELERDWNLLVRTFHYLGHKVIVGRCLKFLVYSGDEMLGAISLSEAAWSVADRDRVLKAIGLQRKDVANNSRFLILPHVKVQNLASRVLALLATEGVRYWNDYYGTDIRCLETFVDNSKYLGTSYRAANWVHVGNTRGFRKAGANHLNGQTPKALFIYPLDGKQRELLRGNSAHQVIIDVP